MATLVSPAEMTAARIKILDHATIPSIDIMKDLEFYEKFLGARANPRNPGGPQPKGHPPPFVNLRTERIQAGRHCNCFFEVPGRGELGIFLQPDFPPEPERLLQGPRYGLAAVGQSLDMAAAAFKEHGIEFLGPVEQEPESPFGLSIYFQDPSGNSLEVSTWRDPALANSVADGGPGLIPSMGLVQVALDVIDLDKAEEFYAAGVGFVPSHRGKTADGLDKAVLRSREGSVLTLQKVNAMPKRPGWKSSGKIHFAVTLDDADWPGFADEMKSRKAELLEVTGNAAQGHPEGDDIYTCDPSGNIIEVGTLMH